jgi:hypothetical protein
VFGGCISFLGFLVEFFYKLEYWSAEKPEPIHYCTSVLKNLETTDTAVCYLHKSLLIFLDFILGKILKEWKVKEIRALQMMSRLFTNFLVNGQMKKARQIAGFFCREIRYDCIGTQDRGLSSFLVISLASQKTYNLDAFPDPTPGRRKTDNSRYKSDTNRNYLRVNLRSAPFGPFPIPSLQKIPCTLLSFSNFNPPPTPLLPSGDSRLSPLLSKSYPYSISLSLSIIAINCLTQLLLGHQTKTSLFQLSTKALQINPTSSKKQNSIENIIINSQKL